jgi:hypothetical protein
VIELTVDQTKLIKLAKIMRAEANSSMLKKDLIASFKVATDAGISAVQSKLRAVPNDSGVKSSPPLGTYLAARVKLSVRLGGQSAGVKIRIQQTPSLRGFKMAARRFNRVSWKHRVFGQDVWVTQNSPIPGYFDDTLAGYKKEYTEAVLLACRRMARRLGEGL